MTPQEVAIKQQPSPSSESVDSAYQQQLLKLFRLSVLKQRKWAEILRLLGPTQGLRGLDVGSDNGVISYLLRQQGGSWVSADLDPVTVEAIRAMVGSGVIQLNSSKLDFPDQAFDRIVLIDCVEHVQDDRRFLEEISRIARSGGEIIINVPHRKESALRRLRVAIGQTDEAHGHVRHGYTFEQLQAACPPSLTFLEHRTYSRFFSELIDTVITWGVRRAKSQPHGGGVKGTVVTGQDLAKHKKLFFVYSAVYPLLWCASQLDKLIGFRSGYMLIARARVKG